MQKAIIFSGIRTGFIFQAILAETFLASLYGSASIGAILRPPSWNTCSIPLFSNTSLIYRIMTIRSTSIRMGTTSISFPRYEMEHKGRIALVCRLEKIPSISAQCHIPIQSVQVRSSNVMTRNHSIAAPAPYRWKMPLMPPNVKQATGQPYHGLRVSHFPVLGKGIT